MATGERPIIIKKIIKGGAGHHGGAWKVAYADFVTAMMAFFLLMWLINTTSPEQKRGVADYFAPASVSETTSGAGGILGGSALGSDGSKSAGSSDVIEELAPSSRNPNDGVPSTVFRYDLVWEFVSAITEGRDCVPGFDHGALAQAVADATLESFEKKTWVNLDAKL